MTVKEARAALAEGEDQIQFVFFANEVLNRVRERHLRQATCPKCGVFRTSKGPCLNIRQCHGREDEINVVLKHSPLNIPESPLQHRDVFMMLRHEQEIKTLLEARNQQFPNLKPRRFRDMLGVSARFMEVLRELRTEV